MQNLTEWFMAIEHKHKSNKHFQQPLNLVN